MVTSFFGCIKINVDLINLSVWSYTALWDCLWRFIRAQNWACQWGLVVQMQVEPGNLEENVTPRIDRHCSPI